MGMSTFRPETNEKTEKSNSSVSSQSSADLVIEDGGDSSARNVFKLDQLNSNIVTYKAD
jgi:hypothetical protein